MAACANTILLDFKVENSSLTQDGFNKLEMEVVEGLEKHFGVNSMEKLMVKTLPSKGDHLSVFMGPQQSVINLRTFSNGLVSIIIDYLRDGDEEPLLTTLAGKALELALGKLGKDIKSVTLPPIKRGTPFDICFPLSDGRLVEYDVDKVIYDARSPFQRVQIMHSKTFGNILVLDGLPNLAESDLVYTESIMCRGTEDYKDKEILILGGGDGALLNELRKENPKQIIMVEIDEMVMKTCQDHLRSACGDTLDSYIGKNYKIIVGDCIKYIEKCVFQGKKFDYVISDLTDIPISETPQGEMWEFIKKVIRMSFSVLNDTGKFLTHGTGISGTNQLAMFQGVIEGLEIPLSFTRTHAFVPSFLDDWIFYQIQRKTA
ncbi:unnamed protein product [Orchesella dallaii]|uniref:PABS domain-containing protein n=1 Tax=Orchesella dallaii TaxID=48710 RepID=A0ABP1QQT0_9HEXA